MLKGEGCDDSGIVTVVTMSLLPRYTVPIFFSCFFVCCFLPWLIVTHGAMSVTLVPIFSCSSTRVQTRAHYLPIFVMSLCVCLLSIHSEFIFPSSPFTRTLHTFIYIVVIIVSTTHHSHTSTPLHIHRSEVDHNKWFRLEVAHESRSGLSRTIV
jgi:hypothetical protein